MWDSLMRGSGWKKAGYALRGFCFFLIFYKFILHKGGVKLALGVRVWTYVCTLLAFHLSH